MDRAREGRESRKRECVGTPECKVYHEAEKHERKDVGESGSGGGRERERERMKERERVRWRKGE